MNLPTEESVSSQAQLQPILLYGPFKCQVQNSVNLDQNSIFIFLKNVFGYAICKMSAIFKTWMCWFYYVFQQQSSPTSISWLQRVSFYWEFYLCCRAEVSCQAYTRNAVYCKFNAVDPGGLSSDEMAQHLTATEWDTICVNTFRPWQNGWHFADNIFMCISWKKLFPESLSKTHNDLWCCRMIFIEWNSINIIQLLQLKEVCLDVILPTMH